jgi:hypothetical protein
MAVLTAIAIMPLSARQIQSLAKLLSFALTNGLAALKLSRSGIGRRTNTSSN